MSDMKLKMNSYEKNVVCESDGVSDIMSLP